MSNTWVDLTSFLFYKYCRSCFLTFLLFFFVLFCFFFFSEGDPDNFLTYFKRATVLLAMGRSKSALPDLDRVLELKPDFFQVAVQFDNNN